MISILIFIKKSVSNLTCDSLLGLDRLHTDIVYCHHGDYEAERFLNLHNHCELVLMWVHQESLLESK